MSKKLHDVLTTLQGHREIIQKFGVRQLSLFGSFARGENTETSDLDFIVDFEKVSFDSYMDLKFYLEKLLGTPVDLVLIHTLKERLRSIILKEAVRVPGL